MDKNKQEMKSVILEGTLRVFNQKGIKFTMDDVAKELSMSKKTIYTVFKDKEDMFYAMVDYLFDAIKQSKDAVLADETLSTKDKIKKIMAVMPDSYKQVEFKQLYMLRSKYPGIYARVEERLETGWEDTIALMKQGMEEGVIRPVSIPLVKMMLEASLEQFFQRDVLVSNEISYVDALNEVVGILVDGIAAK